VFKNRVNHQHRATNHKLGCLECAQVKWGGQALREGDLGGEGDQQGGEQRTSGAYRATCLLVGEPKRGTDTNGRILGKGNGQSWSNETEPSWEVLENRVMLKNRWGGLIQEKGGGGGVINARKSQEASCCQIRGKTDSFSEVEATTLRIKERENLNSRRGLYLLMEKKIMQSPPHGKRFCGRWYTDQLSKKYKGIGFWGGAGTRAHFF